MRKSDKSKLIALNVLVLGAGVLASFILPMIGDSLTDGRSDFLRMMLHVFPLFVAMLGSSMLIGSMIGEPTP